MQHLAGKAALVTGGGNGIGRAIAEALAARDVRVLIADIDPHAAADAAAAIATAGGAAIAVACDIAEPDCFERLRDRMISAFGRTDIVVNNAGILLSGLPLEIPVAEWQRVFDINLMAVVRSNAAFLPGLIAQGAGHLVNTASFAGLYGYAYDRLPYAASKAALISLSEGLALYLRPLGIGVTCLCPGPVRTTIMSRAKFLNAGLEIRAPGPQFALQEPETVGAQVVEAIRENRFFLPTDPQVRDVLIRRATDFDGFVEHQIAHPHIVVPART
ncbi:SDR family NAD(P)-dependent oxidoreductase [Flavisphingomonas formosensis]|uniref:SDR family NAD(P)-dependent oxidoreductase n=1 Tax=Flavisphingomonas formosensis TaxID=861534 RepID=UPI0012F727A4|nr:SDR family oxidoreductase [Sphingomonas formosensis]